MECRCCVLICLMQSLGKFTDELYFKLYLFVLSLYPSLASELIVSVLWRQLCTCKTRQQGIVYLNIYNSLRSGPTGCCTHRYFIFNSGVVLLQGTREKYEHSVLSPWFYSAISYRNFFLVYSQLLCTNWLIKCYRCSALSLWYIVKRTKQCLDFTLTVHLIHFIICCIYNSRVPTSMSWWITNIVVIVIMTVLGEFLCMRTEMKEIPLGTSSKVDL